MRYSGIPREVYNLATAWHFFLLIALIILVAWVRIYYQKKYLTIFRKAVWAKYKPAINKDDRIGPDLYNLCLNAVFILSFGFMLFQADRYYHLNAINLNGPLLLIFYCIAVLVVYSVKMLVNNFNGFVFDVEILMREYTDYIYLNLKTLGLIVLPLNILITYADHEYTYIFFGIFYVLYGVFWLLRIITGMLYGISANISLSYLFLYLCTLEILPVLLLLKLLFTRG
ncbi:MAG: DUF4271 domain-containing protein [Bacteroidota bacterium]